MKPDRPQPHRILVVEDEDLIAQMIRSNLRAEGFEVATAASGNDGLARQEEFQADLIVLDVMLPDINGFEVLRTLRRRGDEVPVIMLTARTTREDRILGLSYGADDYLGKPFSMLELSARIQAILRRSEPRVAPPRILKSGPFRINFVTLTAHRFKVDLNLSLREFRILEVLVTNPGRTHSRRELLNLAWEPAARPSLRTVDAHIANLRKKLGDSPETPVIQTLDREGYRWLLPVLKAKVK